MAIVEFVNQQGQVCKFQWPPRDLSDLEEMHRECGVSADGELEMENSLLVGSKDTLKFSHGSATGAELAEYAERQEADRVVKRFVEDGLGTYAQGLEKYLRLHPAARARIAGVEQSPEDLLKKQGADKGYTVIDGAGTKYHISGAQPKAEDQPDPDGAEVVTIVDRGVARYVIHGAIAAQDYQKKPGLDKPKDAETARKALWRRANELSKMSPSDAMLQAILEHPELLEIIREASEE